MKSSGVTFRKLKGDCQNLAGNGYVVISMCVCAHACVCGGRCQRIEYRDVEAKF